LNRDGLFAPRQPGEGEIPEFRISHSRTDLHHSSLKGIPVAVLILALLAVALGAVVRVAAPAVLKTDSGAAKLVSYAFMVEASSSSPSTPSPWSRWERSGWSISWGP
jgi:hypothetical protein